MDSPSTTPPPDSPLTEPAVTSTLKTIFSSADAAVDRVLDDITFRRLETIEADLGGGDSLNADSMERTPLDPIQAAYDAAIANLRKLIARAESPSALISRAIAKGTLTEASFAHVEPVDITAYKAQVDDADEVHGDDELEETTTYVNKQAEDLKSALVARDNALRDVIYAPPKHGAAAPISTFAPLHPAASTVDFPTEVRVVPKTEMKNNIMTAINGIKVDPSSAQIKLAEKLVISMASDNPAAITEARKNFESGTLDGSGILLEAAGGLTLHACSVNASSPLNPSKASNKTLAEPPRSSVDKVQAPYARLAKPLDRGEIFEATAAFVTALLDPESEVFKSLPSRMVHESGTALEIQLEPSTVETLLRRQRVQLLRLEALYKGASQALSSNHLVARKRDQVEALTQRHRQDSPQDSFSLPFDEEPTLSTYLLSSAVTGINAANNYAAELIAIFANPFGSNALAMVGAYLALKIQPEETPTAFHTRLDITRIVTIAAARQEPIDVGFESLGLQVDPNSGIL